MSKDYEWKRSWSDACDRSNLVAKMFYIETPPFAPEFFNNRAFEYRNCIISLLRVPTITIFSSICGSWYMTRQSTKNFLSSYSITHFKKNLSCESFQKPGFPQIPDKLHICVYRKLQITVSVKIRSYCPKFLRITTRPSNFELVYYHHRFVRFFNYWYFLNFLNKVIKIQTKFIFSEIK